MIWDNQSTIKNLIFYNFLQQFIIRRCFALLISRLLFMIYR